MFDASGRRVATLLDEDLPPGSRSVAWDGRDAGGRMASAGLYFVRLTTARGAVSRRIVRTN